MTRVVDRGRRQVDRAPVLELRLAFLDVLAQKDPGRPQAAVGATKQITTECSKEGFVGFV